MAVYSHAMIDDINTGNTKLWKYVDDTTIAECFDKKVTCDQAIFFFWRGKKIRLIQLFVNSSASSPESGLPSDWS